jgi:phenylalanyl-tRNA synthetase beta chain
VPLRNHSITFDPKRAKALGGIEISAEKQYDILMKLGMQTTSKASDAQWQMQIAEWRHDIEGEADLVEEVLRVYGYDNIEAVSVKSRDMSALPHQPATVTLRQNAQRALAASGMQEAVTWSFMKEELADHFVDPALNIDTSAITLTNPISSDLSRLRSSVLPNLIEAAKRNHDRGHGDTALFEIGPIFTGNGPKDTQDVACGIRHGFFMPKNWNNEGDHRPVDLFDARADALRAIVACGGPAAPQITADAPSWYHPGRSGVLRLGKMVLAHFGEIHPAILDKIDIQGPVAGFEVFLNAIPQKKAKNAAKPLLKASNLQPLSRDFAFLFDENVEAGAIMRAVQSADKALINDVRIFDVYQGKGIAEGEKSIAISVRIQPQDATLKEQEIEALSNKIVEHVTKQTGGKLRA